MPNQNILRRTVLNNLKIRDNIAVRAADNSILSCIRILDSHNMAYLYALFLKIFWIFVRLSTVLDRNSIPLRGWLDTYLYDLYHSAPDNPTES